MKQTCQPHSRSFAWPMVSARAARCSRGVLVRADLSQGSAKGGRNRVVALGEALFDLIADQQGLPRDKVQSWTPFAGGAPANVATSLARLGMDVVFVSALGKDAPGDKLFKLLQDSGVKMHAVQRRDDPTRDVYVTRDEQGDREFAGFGRPSEEYSDAYLDAGKLPVEEIKSAALLITGTLGLAYPKTKEAMLAAVKAAKEGGCKVLVDVNWRSVFWQDHGVARTEIDKYLQQADLIKLSDADLIWLLEITPDIALTDPARVAQFFPKAQGILITAGELGASYCFRTSTKAEHAGFVPVFKLNTIDTTGAGDAFTAGFLYKVLQAGGLEALSADPKALRQAVVFASAAGALTCTRKGAIEGQPTLKEVEELYYSIEKQA